MSKEHHSEDGKSDNLLDEEAILRSPEGRGGAFQWVKTALSPLLSASVQDEMDALFEDHLSFIEKKDDSNEPKVNCSFKGCKRMIGPSSSKFNCPGCSGVYCSTHSGHPSFEIKILSLDKEEDQSRQSAAKFIRVCLSCWMSRPENQTGMGVERSWMNLFEHRSAETKATIKSKRNLLESRLVQLIQIEDSGASNKKELQCRVVTWMPDDNFQHCPFCKSEFTALNRRHHCRLCGTLVCGGTDCLHKESLYSFPACPDCHSLLSSQSRIIKVTAADPLLRHYQALAASRNQIMHNYPKFDEYFALLEYELEQPTRDTAKLEAIRSDLEAIRKTLKVLFDHFEPSAQTIAGLRTEDGSQRDIVLRNIALSSHQFVMQYRLPLKMLPGVLSLFDADHRAEELKESPATVDVPSSFTKKFLPSFMQPNQRIFGVKEPEIPLPANLGALMQKLEVLHEQKCHLEAMLEDSRVNRRYADMTSLQANLEEIQNEIDDIKLMCSK